MRGVGWPQARDRVAKPEGARLAAAEELISRERNVDFAGEECWLRRVKPTFLSREIGWMLIPRRRAGPRTPKPARASCRATAQHLPRGCPSARIPRRPT